jgi:hypothetical protein
VVIYIFPGPVGPRARWVGREKRLVVITAAHLQEICRQLSAKQDGIDDDSNEIDDDEKSSDEFSDEQEFFRHVPPPVIAIPDLPAGMATRNQVIEFMKHRAIYHSCVLTPNSCVLDDDFLWMTIDLMY